MEFKPWGSYEIEMGPDQGFSIFFLVLPNEITVVKYGKTDVPGTGGHFGRMKQVAASEDNEPKKISLSHEGMRGIPEFIIKDIFKRTRNYT